VTKNEMTFAPITVGEMKERTRARGRKRVVFVNPFPDRDTRGEIFPYIELNVCQWPGDHPHRPWGLFVDSASQLVRYYQEEHPDIDTLGQMMLVIKSERLSLPVHPEGEHWPRRRGLGIHSDNMGWQYGEAPDESELMLYDATVSGGGDTRAEVYWTYTPYMETTLMVVKEPPGLADRALALVDQELESIRGELLNRWLGGPEVVRRLLGMSPD